MKFKIYIFPLTILLVLTFNLQTKAQHSTAREWNEALLYSISKDFARPTVHARNLFHMSIIMYDAWAVYEEGTQTYLIGQNLYGYSAPFQGTPIPEDIQSAQDEAISFACFRFISHRYANSPGLFVITDSIQSLMESKGYNYNNASIDYINGGPAEMGNYIAKQLINYGFTDGSNEGGNYANTYYSSINPPIEVENPGNPDILYPNRWQRITLTQAIDQAGQPVANTPPFLSPEWGDVNPFSMKEADKTVLNRDGHNYNVYHDPGEPALFNALSEDGINDPYKWNHLLVAIWSSHLSIDDDVVLDASPASIGNITGLPDTQEEMLDFYNLFEGGDPGEGYDINPITGLPYEPQLVKRGDYARVLAEFWADGPNSVTPPGHWFDILNHVTDHPLFERKWMGIGPELPKLEYDVKSYLALGGAMHDAAITAWSIKGYYDYIRPVSAIRFMVDNGQCSDPEGPNYNLSGAPLIPGYIEMVEEGDPLAGELNENVGKVKIYAWRGPEHIENPDTDHAGVGWILGENWWPYQRPSFVTPPFAGYISGHSTYSRTAAELMTILTGSEYFPGGMSNFVAEQNEFLVFEEGPSETVELQWAKYNDASDQCSLSRIWGGIHPPIDDIPGRKIGMELGPSAFMFADSIVSSVLPYITSIEFSDDTLTQIDNGDLLSLTVNFSENMDSNFFPTISFFSDNPTPNALEFVNANWISSTSYQFNYSFIGVDIELTNIVFGLSGAKNEDGVKQIPFAIQNALYIDNKKPSVENTTCSTEYITDSEVVTNQFLITFQFNENCDYSDSPAITLIGSSEITGSLIYNNITSAWQDGSTYVAAFDLIDEEIEIDGIDVIIENIADNFGNALTPSTQENLFSIDTKNPIANNITVSDAVLNQLDLGAQAITFNITFDEVMNTQSVPSLLFINDDPTVSSLVFNTLNSNWISDTECEIVYDLLLANEELQNIGVSLANFSDLNGNPGNSNIGNNLFEIDTKKPEISSISPSTNTISDSNIGSQGFSLEIEFTEPMQQSQVPLVNIIGENIDNSLQYQIGNSEWINPYIFHANFLVSDNNIEVDELIIDVDFATDSQGNPQTPYEEFTSINLDTRNPIVLSVSASEYDITNDQVGEEGLYIIIIFDEEMDQWVLPTFSFTPEEPANSVLSLNNSSSLWLNPFSFKAVFDVNQIESAYEENLTINIINGADIAGNSFDNEKLIEFITIQLGAVGVEQRSAENVITLFPNPLNTGEPLLISTSHLDSDVSINILNSNGQKVYSTRFDYLTSGTTNLNLPNLSSGIYVISYQSKQVLFTRKIIIE